MCDDFEYCRKPVRRTGRRRTVDELVEMNVVATSE
jgi:hypothetical protein